MFFLDNPKDENSKNENKDQSTDQVVDPLSNYRPGGVEGFSTNPKVILSELTNKEVWNGLKESLTDVAGNYETLVKSSQLLANSMGIGQARANELKLTIADTLPELTKVGLTTSESFKAIQEAPVALGTNTTIARETIVELGATTKFTGLEVKDLAATFKNAGFELGNVAETMADVANYAKSVGTNVLAVTELVSKNLQQLNLFNFENGVDGLAKMASSATMLGYDMGKVLAKADELLSPEKAIDFSASLQRLGVTSTELLDPLSAMDLAMNNPERLAKEMEGVAKQFVQLKADGSGFEIMPGAKLQLREVAKELGMNADEFAKMALRSADFDMKLQQIRFPSFAASEEDKMLIANMAQMKDGRAVVQIEEDDEIKEVAVEDLTAEQLKELQKEQANQNKTAEELAIDQLNVLQKIQQNTAAGIQATQLGTASSGPIRRYLDTLQDIRLAGTENTLGKIETKEVRGAVQGVTKPLESALVDFVKDPSIENLTGILPAFTESVGSLGSSVEKLISGVPNSIVGMGDQIYKSLSKTYGDVGTQKGSVTSFVSESMNYENKTNQLETKSTNNVNVSQNVSGKIDITLSSNGGITQDQMNELVTTKTIDDVLVDRFTNSPSVRNATASAANNSDPFNK
jgi:hypothetical protein